MATHEGWKNYETWCINLWISNEEPLYRYWREAAGWAKQQGSKQTAVYKLSDRMKDELSRQVPNVKGVWADLLNAALAEVDWDEIAKAWIEE